MLYKSSLKLYMYLTLSLSLVVGVPTVAYADKVVVASKLFTEQYVMAHMLSQVIEANTDLDVTMRMNLGDTGIVHKAMLTEQVDIYVDYTYTGWLTVLKNDIPADGNIIPELEKQYKDLFDIEWVSYLGFVNKHVITVKNTTAAEYNLTTISSIKAHEKNIVIAGEPSVMVRVDAWPNYIKHYGLKFSRKNIKEVSGGLKYSALMSDQADMVISYSTDAQIHYYNLTILEDDKGIETEYEAAIVARSEVLEEYPELRAALSTFDNLISVEEMRDMNYQVEVEKVDPEDVARDFLVSKGIL